MTDYYNDIYLKRLNQYGTNIQERVQGKREHEFQRRVQKSVYKVSFSYNNNTYIGTLEKKKQTNSEILQYLLTQRDLILPNGTIIEIAADSQYASNSVWMVYWLEDIRASGYNRYTMLRMTHQLNWMDRSKTNRTAWVYLYGQEDNMLKDELKSRSRSNVLYTENLKLSFFVTSVNEYIQKDDYIEIGTGNLKEGYRVTGYDRISTPGVEFVSIDPVYIFDRTTITPPQGDTSEDWNWIKLQGG